MTLRTSRSLSRDGSTPGRFHDAGLALPGVTSPGPEQPGCLPGGRPPTLVARRVSRGRADGPPDAGAAREANISAQQPKAGQESRVPPPDVDPCGAGHPQGPSAEGPASPLCLIEPVRDRASFAALRRSGRRVRRGPLTLTFVPGVPADPPRVAYAIGRKVGGAVVRNRLRRRLRVVVSELGPLVQPGAYLIAAAPGAATLSFGELRTIVAEALEDLAGTSDR